MIYLSIRFFDENSLKSLPLAGDVLGPRELAETVSFATDKRRQEYLAARVTVKEMLRTQIPAARGLESRQVEVWKEPTGLPYAVLGGSRRLPGRLSISHSHGWVFAGYAEEDLPFGVDVEWVEPRAAAFAADYFTPREQALFDRLDPAARDARITLAWSAKEAYMKAAGTGLSIDPRALEVETLPRPIGALNGRWQALRVNGVRADLTACPGYWFVYGGMVFTLCGQAEVLDAIRESTPVNWPAA